MAEERARREEDKHQMEEVKLSRYGFVGDSIAMEGELFVLFWCYTDKGKNIFRMTPTIKFKDSSGRSYKQTFCIDIVNKNGDANIVNYVQPELCEDGCGFMKLEVEDIRTETLI